MSVVSLRSISRLVGYRKIEAALLARLPAPLRLKLDTLRYRRSIRRAVAGPSPVVLVYTAPKVASSAVAAALLGAGQAVFQVHMISADSMRSLHERMRRRGLVNMKLGAFGLKDIGKVITSELLAPRHPARIVSLVRDPVARNISFYFQTLDDLWQTERAYERVSVERLLAEFHERFRHERGIEWFDEEFKPVLGIDVYEHPFPRDLGYQRIDSGPYEVLIMRHDLDDRVKEKCLAELIGVGPVSLRPANVGAEKPYADVYREFLRRVELPEGYVNRMLESKYARHFYGPEELARFRTRWLKGKSAEGASRGPSVSLACGAN